jgi:hypothetical protein
MPAPSLSVTHYRSQGRPAAGSPSGIPHVLDRLRCHKKAHPPTRPDGLVVAALAALAARVPQSANPCLNVRGHA